VTFYWPDDELLEELGIDQPMMGRDGSWHFANEVSQAAGLRYRSLADTAIDTLAWWQALPDERKNNPRRWPNAAQEASAIEQMKSGGT